MEIERLQNVQLNKNTQNTSALVLTDTGRPLPDVAVAVAVADIGRAAVYISYSNYMLFEY